MARNYTKPTTDPLTGQLLNKNGSPRKAKGKLLPELDRSQQVKRILELAAVDTPQALIASTTGTTLYDVTTTLKEYSHIFNQLEKLPTLRAKKRDLVEATMFKTLESITSNGKLDEASLRDHAYAFDVLHKATRLESNQSTSNNAHLTFIGDGPSLDDIDL